MNTKLVIKSAFLFSLLVISAHAQELQPAVLSASSGRYVFGQISSMRADQYMLDTQTGRLWHLVVDTNDAPCLLPVPYKSIGGSFILSPATPQEELQELQNAVRAAKNEQQKTEPPNTALEPTGVGAGSSATRTTSQPAGGSASGR
jgi:hypothetical protein